MRVRKQPLVGDELTSDKLSALVLLALITEIEICLNLSLLSLSASEATFIPACCAASGRNFNSFQGSFCRQNKVYKTISSVAFYLNIKLKSDELLYTTAVAAKMFSHLKLE